MNASASTMSGQFSSPAAFRWQMCASPLTDRDHTVDRVQYRLTLVAHVREVRASLLRRDPRQLNRKKRTGNPDLTSA